jgi:cell division protein FtsI (penicillin-binding protein 3)
MMASPLGNGGGASAPAVERGAITDRNGRLLALQTTVYTCSASANNLKDPAQAAARLAPLLGLDEAGLAKRLTEAKGWIIIKPLLQKPEADPVRELIDAGKLPGIYLEEAVNRAYPEGSAAAQVIGFTGTDNEGMEGIEYACDQELARHNVAMPDGRSYGNQVTLTLDMGVQHAMEGIADQALAENKPTGLMILVMDAATGELLAYVVRPSFDPNQFRKSSAEQRRNLPLSYTYEPGSVFKIFSIAGIMHLGGIGGDTQFQTSGGYHNKLFRDPITDLTDYGNITPEGVIKYSSNVGAAFASDTVNVQQFSDLVRNFGFGGRTGLELPGEELGLLKEPADWSPRTKPTMAIGQEINVTAMQMVSAATAIANRGVLLKPHIIKRITAPNGQIVAEFGREPLREILKPAVAANMLGYMNAATDDSGTGHRSRVEGIDLSVKTGTAQIYDPSKGRYSTTDFIASSLAIFPTEQPKVIMYVVIIKPKGESIYGGRIAAPLIKAGAEFLIPYLGIDRKGDYSYVQGSQLRVTSPELPPLKDRIGDYRGLPLRALLPLFARPDLKVELSGDGQVTAQDPAPGSPFKTGMTLKLFLGGAAP